MDSEQGGAREPKPKPGADLQGPQPTHAADLETRLQTMKQEIDALQIHVSQIDRPWYRQIANIIAILALLFSFGTTVVSFRHTSQQDLQQDRSELRELSERIYTLERDKIEFSQRYSKDQSIIESYAFEVDSELLVTAWQAAEIIERIPEHVTTAECTTVADQLADFDNNEHSMSILDIGIDRARDAGSLIQALYRYAEVLFAIGDFSSGGQKYQEALKVHERFPSRDRDYVRYTAARTQLTWAQSEIQYGRCKQAMGHVQAAAKYAEDINDEGWRDEILSWANDQKKSAAECAAS